MKAGIMKMPKPPKTNGANKKINYSYSYILHQIYSHGITEMNLPRGGVCCETENQSF
jgi:hypothetical protein